MLEKTMLCKAEKECKNGNFYFFDFSISTIKNEVYYDKFS